MGVHSFATAERGARNTALRHTEIFDAIAVIVQGVAHLSLAMRARSRAGGCVVMGPYTTTWLVHQLSERVTSASDEHNHS
jgi:hypothetical protein